MMIHRWESLRLFIPGEKIVLLLIVSYQMFYCPNIKIPEATGNDEKPFSCSCLTKNSQRETLCKCSISTTRVRQLVMMNNHSAARVVTRNSRRETFWKCSITITRVKQLVKMNNHSAAHVVTRNLRLETLWKCSITTTRVKQLVMMNNHSAARVVTRNSHRETL